MDSFVRIALVAVGVVAALYAGCAGLLFAYQSRLVYHPLSALVATPAEAGLTYEDVRFPAEDGVALHGWWVPYEEPDRRGTVLFCHGNAGNVSHRVEVLRVLHDLKLATFIFDYRGYGRSEGKPSEEGTYRDADGAWSYVTETLGIPPSEIVLFGRSLGAAIAAHLAERHEVRLLWLEGSFTSASDLGVSLYPYLPVRSLTRFRYSTRDRLRGVRSAVLITHSPGDEIVPYDHGRALFDAANEPKTFLELVGGHNDGLLVPTNYGQIERFLSRLDDSDVHR